jgi:hypothetical protein
MSRSILLIAATLTWSLCACANDPSSGPKQDAGTVWGAITGALIGSNFGGGTSGHVAGALAGAGARVAVVYYALESNRIGVWLARSPDAGASWRAPERLHARTMALSWIAQAGGRFLGDYLSTSFVNGRPVPVFALSSPPSGGALRSSGSASRIAGTTGASTAPLPRASSWSRARPAPARYCEIASAHGP